MDTPNPDGNVKVLQDDRLTARTKSFSRYGIGFANPDGLLSCPKREVSQSVRSYARPGDLGYSSTTLMERLRMLEFGRARLVLGVLLWTAWGCGDASSEVCDYEHHPDTITFQLSPSITTLGSYTVSYALPGQPPLDCVFTFPYSEVTCEALSFGDLSHSTAPTRVDWIMLNVPSPGPDSITISIQGYTTLYTGTVVPTYALDEPNGPGCGVRKTGTVTLALR